MARGGDFWPTTEEEELLRVAAEHRRVAKQFEHRATCEYVEVGRQLNRAVQSMLTNPPYYTGHEEIRAERFIGEAATRMEISVPLAKDFMIMAIAEDDGTIARLRQEARKRYFADGQKDMRPLRYLRFDDHRAMAKRRKNWPTVADQKKRRDHAVVDRHDHQRTGRTLRIPISEQRYHLYATWLARRNVTYRADIDDHIQGRIAENYRIA